MHQILVIGATGFVGTHLRHHFEKRPGISVLGTSTTGRDNTRRFDLAKDSIVDSLPEEWLRGNVTSGRWAVLAAGISPMDRCHMEPDLARAVMKTGSERCAIELTRYGYRIILLSTSYVFGEADKGFEEHEPTAPLNCYGTLKRDLEQSLEKECPDVLIARLGKVVGGTSRQDHLLSAWHRQALRKEPIRCIAHQRLQPTLVDDVYRALYLAMQATLSGRYHIANPKPIERAALAERFLMTCGLETTIESVPIEMLDLVENRPISSWLDSSKICRELGFQFTSTDTILQRYRAC